MKMVFIERAKRDWKRLDRSVQKQIQKKIAFYLKSPNPLQFAERLKEYEWGDYRFRIGDWRLIFDVENEAIVVLKVGHRKDIYRK